MGHPRYSGPVIDAHAHVDGLHLEMVQSALDHNGISKLVNLWNAQWPPPSFDAWLQEFADRWDNRLVLYHTPDLSRIAEPGFAEFVRKDVAHAAGKGAAGIKVWKNLGLHIRDQEDRLVPVNDARLNPLWEAAADAGLPISIHVADPVAFFQPLDEHNERYVELSEHPDWWFGGPQFPSFEQLIEEFEDVVARHPATTFVGVHMGCYAENLDFVGRMLDSYPNYYVDTSARTGEFGRHGAERVREFFVRHADRILFGSDIARTAAFWFPEKGYYDRTMRDFYDLHWRYYETDERGLPNPFPLQSDWTVDGIDLPEEVLERIYYSNATRVILGGSVAEGDNRAGY
jgi:predicted TIM-barrel fold metal-dependent hydrolase